MLRAAARAAHFRFTVHRSPLFRRLGLVDGRLLRRRRRVNGCRRRSVRQRGRVHLRRRRRVSGWRRRVSGWRRRMLGRRWLLWRRRSRRHRMNDVGLRLSAAARRYNAPLFVSLRRLLFRRRRRRGRRDCGRRSVVLLNCRRPFRRRDRPLQVLAESAAEPRAAAAASPCLARRAADGCRGRRARPCSAAWAAARSSSAQSPWSCAGRSLARRAGCRLCFAAHRGAR